MALRFEVLGVNEGGEVMRLKREWGWVGVLALTEIEFRLFVFVITIARYPFCITLDLLPNLLVLVLPLLRLAYIRSGTNVGWCG